MNHQHIWNTNLPRNDGYYEGFACEDCSALITPDGIVVESPETNWKDLMIVIGIVILIGLICTSL